MNKLDRVFAHAQILGFATNKCEIAKGRIIKSKNWNAKVEIISEFVECFAPKIIQQSVRNRMLFELIPRLSSNEYRLLEYVYDFRVNQIAFAIENSNQFELCNNMCEFIDDSDDPTILHMITNSINIKCIIFKIYERYGNSILANMLSAINQNILSEFLLTFPEWHYGYMIIDIDVIEQFINKLMTF